MNYLCHLDETRDHILNRFKIDARKASATVLVGHPRFVSDYTRRQVDETLRIFNSYHARIEVMHYEELIENAERALALAAESNDVTHDPQEWSASSSLNDLNQEGTAPDAMGRRRGRRLLLTPTQVHHLRVLRGESCSG
jgi:hypothetical protein